MANGLVQLYLMIKAYLSTGRVWWHMPLALTMAYSLFERERLLNFALFDSYPNPLPGLKRRCNDPMLGDGYVGCCDASMLQEYRFQQQSLHPVTPEDCTAKCKTNMFVYAALHKGNLCLCGMSYKFESKAKECQCRIKCKGNKKKRCGGKKHVSLYHTYFCAERTRAARTIDGTCNDLNTTAAGSRFYRFGRNVPLKHAYTDEALLLKPNPRNLARKLLQRKNFLQVPWLNLFGVAWVQFMIHDWFDHGTSAKKNPIKITLEPDDPLYKKMRGEMKVRRTWPDSCRSDSDPGPQSFQNNVTHWWDGSQIYGSDTETHMKVRSFVHGKLAVDDDGLLPVDPKTNIDMTGFSNNWWVGLSILHNLFTREHNLICDMLLSNHPNWTDEQLFQTARLINTAEMVRIHTLEWTAAILNTEFIHESLVAQWYGRLSPRVLKWLHDNNVHLGKNSFPVHIGSPPDYRGVPFSLTEEFVSVYRMHSLLPDEIAIRRMPKGESTGKSYKLPKYSFGFARKVFDQNKLDDVLFTFGVEKAGQLVLHNYPTTLMNLRIPKHQKGGFVDMATIDILRDRERGVPRYNMFRRLLNLTTPDTFLKLTDDSITAAELSEAYDGDIESVDLLVGSLAEARPEGFGFGDTPFHLFLSMANRRLMTDRFLTIDYKAEYYTQAGLEWVENSTMKKLLTRNFPEVPGLKDAMDNIKNAFYLWNVK